MDRVVGLKTATNYPLNRSTLLGQGAEGRVYRAGRVCLKVFSASIQARDADKIVTLSGFANRIPGFAWPIEVIADPDSGADVGYAMDYAPGETLESLLDARGTAAIPVLTKVSLALEIARAVASAHASRGPTVILGDLIKSGNLIISDSSAVFVDAASVSLRGFRARSGDVLESLSRLSTPGYVAREVLDNPQATPSHAADRFALAVLLFELLTGRAPHEPRPCPAAVGLDPDDAVRRGIFPRYTRHPEFEPPTYDAIDIPDDVDDLFRAAFLSSAVRPTADQWCRELEVWLQRVTPPPPPAPPDAAPADPPPPAAVVPGPWLTPHRLVVALCLALLAAQAFQWAGPVLAVSAPQAAVEQPLPSPPPTPVGPPLFQEVFQ